LFHFVANYLPTKSFLKDAADKKVRKQEKHEMIYDILIDQYTTRNDIVCDPYAGTAVSGISCQKLGRQWVGVEKFDPCYTCASNQLHNIIKDMRL
jgi:DNA modification methylase